MHEHVVHFTKQNKNKKQILETFRINLDTNKTLRNWKDVSLSIPSNNIVAPKNITKQKRQSLYHKNNLHTPKTINLLSLIAPMIPKIQTNIANKPLANIKPTAVIYVTLPNNASYSFLETRVQIPMPNNPPANIYKKVRHIHKNNTEKHVSR